MVARARALAGVTGFVAIALAGCGSQAYCAAVREYGSLPTEAPTAPISEHLREIVELAPPAIKPQWEEFVAGLEKLVEAGTDPDQAEDLSSELQAIAEELSVDAQERCA